MRHDGVDGSLSAFLLPDMSVGGGGGVYLGSVLLITLRTKSDLMGAGARYSDRVWMVLTPCWVLQFSLGRSTTGGSVLFWHSRVAFASPGFRRSPVLVGRYVAGPLLCLGHIVLVLCASLSRSFCCLVLWTG